jgi:hypothetical protein
MILGATGVLHADELARLRRLRRRAHGEVPIATPADATEAGGEIASADLALMPDAVKVRTPRT